MVRNGRDGLAGNGDAMTIPAAIIIIIVIVVWVIHQQREVTRSKP